MKALILIILTFLTCSCNSQKTIENNDQIGEYVTSIFEDTKGHLWFGTIQKGIAKYDGEQLVYYSDENGLPTQRVTSVTQDSNDVYWFQTGEGIVKYDGKEFTTFRVSQEDIGSNKISQFLIDSKGNFWIGTWSGVYLFDGQHFSSFELPTPKIETIINQDTKGWITEITEDSQGNIWFGRDGYGACKYDGKSFTHYLKKDGLHSNHITNIKFVDEEIWFGTRVAEKDNPDPKKRLGSGGVNTLVNDTIISYLNIESFNKGDVYCMHIGDDGDLWISTVADGVYRYKDGAFKHYDVPISVMSMLNDIKGRMWLAGAGGLYRITDQGEVINVTTNGPWK